MVRLRRADDSVRSGLPWSPAGTMAADLTVRPDPTMTLRTRLVLALSLLFAIGLVVYGVGTYDALSDFEAQSFDEDLVKAVPLVVEQLTGSSAGFDAPPPGDKAGGPDGGQPDPEERGPSPPTGGDDRGPGGGPERLRPGVTGRVYEDGEEVAATSGDGGPSLDSVDLTATGLSTVPGTEDVSRQWRVYVEVADDRTAVVAAPLTGLERTLDRLVLVEVLAGLALLVLLAAGTWAILGAGLRPLERMAATARSVNAGSLTQRVEEPDRPDSEVGQLAAALNGMLDDLEVAFREREATEARLRRFLADASHELRTPLTSIQGFAELFRIGADSEHVDTATAMRRIEEESQRMRDLVEDLLALARLDELRPLQTEPVDLAVLAADACSDAVAAQPGRPVRLDAPAPVTVRGDQAQLRQALGNLVANALRHTAHDTPIEVAAHRDGDDAVLTVRDHGDGLSPEALDHVFDRFWQQDEARAGAGSGLGLAIVQAVAERHGGQASATNTDGGALFTLRLPASPDVTPAG